MIPFIDLRKQYLAYKDEIDQAIQEVLDQSAFIGGKAITQLEEELSAFCGSPYSIVCSSGTDALLLALMALDIGPGDEVIVPDFTFFATAEAVCLTGATPVFADIDPETYNIDPRSVASCITPRTRAVIAVSLFGQCADFDSLLAICDRHGLALIEDGAQSFGAMYHGRRSCSIALISTTSFFPAKPLGCYGDGGAVFTADPKLAQTIRVLLNHGQESRYHHVRVGLNARLDTIQAAILRVKLRHFQKELDRRQSIAETYTETLRHTSLGLPSIRPGLISSWAQYTLRHPERDNICAQLAQAGIPTAVHYPLALHQQPALNRLPSAKNAVCPQSVSAAREVFSIPIHGWLGEETVRDILKHLLIIIQK